jgi:hypothetical protein
MLWNTYNGYSISLIKKNPIWGRALLAISTSKLLTDWSARAAMAIRRFKRRPTNGNSLYLRQLKKILRNITNSWTIKTPKQRKPSFAKIRNTILNSNLASIS